MWPLVDRSSVHFLFYLDKMPIREMNASCEYASATLDILRVFTLQILRNEHFFRAFIHSMFYAIAGKTQIGE